ncbi:hypothetical protein A7K73_07450 [Candidatus Methylacidiphilum fumarolicum]|uniref:Uncharacterized protein n=2 Tax=Candidatus Methylacidiphilum fumarolicum TaxID=591154 RepID=I0JWI2_METFB|nr:hypothetical protein [Candidatus Methylacidiphilum fumarolicum]MBW6415348.1 hypothetical protein [Candidatus Methylacidiphilum fumarolicum]TFE68677.1 hypothetical protein A7K73_07450 [Candidatus Methylacidiphilum fumarolicum]TFE77502.1 hypothetical protein A7D33_04415 [Candidatus Methylacidiphilum fumarolicum]CAI9085606.1 conserved protein of unknown function [Candidatus Methylacidiphilum fumarolicum]CCG91601.1 hypothetical protein MFUM_170014 [Methylacidiphilum fumariolicum SolV]
MPTQHELVRRPAAEEEGKKQKRDLPFGRFVSSGRSSYFCGEKPSIIPLCLSILIGEEGCYIPAVAKGPAEGQWKAAENTIKPFGELRGQHLLELPLLDLRGEGRGIYHPHESLIQQGDSSAFVLQNGNLGRHPPCSEREGGWRSII